MVCKKTFCRINKQLFDIFVVEVLGLVDVQRPEFGLLYLCYLWTILELDFTTYQVDINTHDVSMSHIPVDMGWILIQYIATNPSNPSISDRKLPLP